MTTAALFRSLRPSGSSANPVNVLVVTHYYARHGGGIEHVADRLIREIARVGACRFVWAAGAGDDPADEGQFEPLPVKIWNVTERLFGIPCPLPSPFGLWQLRKVVRQADVLWLHDTLYPINIAAFWMAHKRGVPILITQHLAPIPYRNRFVRWLMKMADRIFSETMLARAQEVTFISDRVAEEYYRRVTFTRAIKVIPNGVDVRHFYAPIPENRNFLREQFALRENQPVFLFVGRFVERKGLDVLRLLAERLPGCRFWLAGDGPINPDYWLLPNVHVFRERRGEALAALYQAADLLLLPSYGEGFPLVIQESMACGLPVLCAPETAQGCRPAMSHLYVAEVWPQDPAATAEVWLEKIRTFPLSLPLAQTVDPLADFAQSAWDWPPIAQVYADILVALRGKP